MSRVRKFLVAALIGQALLAAPIAAQEYPIRDCRSGMDVVLPVVPNGQDVVIAHAVDDLAGPSIFDRFAKTEDGTKINIELTAYESYAAQIKDFMACETPFLRATHAMLSDLAAVTEADGRTQVQPVYLYGWSNGADALVGRNGASVADLAGAKILTDRARLDFALQLASEVATAPEIIITETPSEDFAADETADFAITSSHQAKILTAGNVGTGAEGSIKGAKTVLTTTSASRVVADILVVRSDYAAANPDALRGLVRAVLKAEELFREDAKKQIVDFELAAEVILGDEGRDGELKDMWSGVETVGLKGQTDWANDTHPRSFRSLINQGQNRMVSAGILAQAVALASPSIDFASLGDGIWDKRRTTTSGFNADAATAAIQAMSNEDIEGNTIASVTIYFKPNQATFEVEEYRIKFEEALDKSMVYAGAVLSVEGHSAYLGYLKGVLKKGWSLPKQKLEMQSLERTSTSRAIAVRQALVETAETMGLAIDNSQITINGRGIEDPHGGFCKGLPCPPKTEEEWRQSRRVIFRVIAMEGEEEVFTPLNDW